MGIWLTQNWHNKDGPTSSPKPKEGRALPILIRKIRLPKISNNKKARRAVYKSKRMVNSLKSFLEVENQKMLCCLPKNAWISGRASEAPGSERIERIVVDTRMILEQRWEKWRKGSTKLRRKSAILVKKRSSRDIYGEPMLLRAGDHLMIEDKHRKSEKWGVRNLF